ncbi:hypothetical protein AB6A40_004138 [Gnathostoma spinigerum]|uniref:Uncharacterized protein n=1 Tax=Gnathostoma spinigerum TaxID=75299 RepID=A0ABD6EBK4_9BILA
MNIFREYRSSSDRNEEFAAPNRKETFQLSDQNEKEESYSISKLTSDELIITANEQSEPVEDSSLSPNKSEVPRTVEPKFFANYKICLNSAGNSLQNFQPISQQNSVLNRIHSEPSSDLVSESRNGVVTTIGDCELNTDHSSQKLSKIYLFYCVNRSSSLPTKKYFDLSEKEKTKSRSTLSNRPQSSVILGESLSPILNPPSLTNSMSKGKSNHSEDLSSSRNLDSKTTILPVGSTTNSKSPLSTTDCSRKTMKNCSPVRIQSLGASLLSFFSTAHRNKLHSRNSHEDSKSNNRSETQKSDKTSSDGKIRPSERHQPTVRFAEEIEPSVLFNSNIGEGFKPSGRKSSSPIRVLRRTRRASQGEAAEQPNSPEDLRKDGKKVAESV